MRFTIPGRLPALNGVIAANRRNPYAGAKLKRDAERIIRAHLPAHCHIDYPADVRILWVEQSRKRDPDNVASAVKFILDALVNAGRLDGDGWRCIRSISHEFAIDRDNPRIEVTIGE